MGFRKGQHVRVLDPFGGPEETGRIVGSEVTRRVEPDASVVEVKVFAVQLDEHPAMTVHRPEHLLADL